MTKLKNFIQVDALFLTHLGDGFECCKYRARALSPIQALVWFLFPFHSPLIFFLPPHKYMYLLFRALVRVFLPLSNTFHSLPARAPASPCLSNIELWVMWAFAGCY